MKVICIDSNWLSNSKRPFRGFPKEGEIVTVDDMEQSDILYYGLIEYPKEWWEAAAFIPLSDIDETEMLREFQKRQKEMPAEMPAEMQAAINEGTKRMFSKTPTKL